MAYIGTTRDTCQIQGLGVITPGTYEAEKTKEAAKGAAKEGQVGPERATGSHREPKRIETEELEVDGRARDSEVGTYSDKGDKGRGDGHDNRQVSEVPNATIIATPGYVRYFRIMNPSIQGTHHHQPSPHHCNVVPLQKLTFSPTRAQGLLG